MEIKEGVKKVCEGNEVRIPEEGEVEGQVKTLYEMKETMVDKG